MTPEPGSRLGPYESTGDIGAGGMGGLEEADGRRFVLVRGSGTGTSDVVLMDGAWTRVAAEGRQ